MNIDNYIKELVNNEESLLGILTTPHFKKWVKSLFDEGELDTSYTFKAGNNLRVDIKEIDNDITITYEYFESNLPNIAAVVSPNSYETGIVIPENTVTITAVLTRKTYGLKTLSSNIFPKDEAYFDSVNGDDGQRLNLLNSDSRVLTLSSQNTGVIGTTQGLIDTLVLSDKNENSVSKQVNINRPTRWYYGTLRNGSGNLAASIASLNNGNNIDPEDNHATFVKFRTGVGNFPPSVQMAQGELAFFLSTGSLSFEVAASKTVANMNFQGTVNINKRNFVDDINSDYLESCNLYTTIAEGTSTLNVK